MVYWWYIGGILVVYWWYIGGILVVLGLFYWVLWFWKKREETVGFCEELRGFEGVVMVLKSFRSR